jgi:hypothetical protein
VAGGRTTSTQGQPQRPLACHAGPPGFGEAALRAAVVPTERTASSFAYRHDYSPEAARALPQSLFAASSTTPSTEVTACVVRSDAGFAGATAIASQRAHELLKSTSCHHLVFDSGGRDERLRRSSRWSSHRPARSVRSRRRSGDLMWTVGHRPSRDPAGHEVSQPSTSGSGTSSAAPREAMTEAVVAVGYRHVDAE